MQDLRYAIRQLLKSPGFTAVAVLSLALGIGANTTIFSLLNGILLRALPVPNPHELRVLKWSGTNPHLRNYTDSRISGGETASRGFRQGDGFPYPAFRAFRESASGLADLFAFHPLFNTTLVAAGEASPSAGLLVSGNFFTAYGGATQLGRPLTPTDDQADATPVAVITYRAWERHFRLDPEVLGQTVTLNKSAFTVVGVLRRDYVGPLAGDPTEIYVPLAAQPQLVPDRPIGSARHWWVQVMGRLAPATNEAQTRAALTGLFRQALAASDSTIEQPAIVLEDGSRGPLAARQNMAQPMWALLALVAVILLLACVNLASMSLARGAARQHEMAVRAALGARRGRLIRQSLIESLVLGLAGAALGLLVALWGQDALVHLLPDFRFGGEAYFDLSLDQNVLGFTVGAALVTAILSGLVPAWRAATVDPLAGLQSRAALGAPRLRLGRVLVASQIGLTMLLVVAAGLTIRTFQNLATVSPGFESTNLLVFRLHPAQADYRGPALLDYYDHVRRELARLPGVQSVALSDLTLLSGSMTISGFTMPGRATVPGETLQANRLVVSESFFATMGIPLRLGRDLAASDSAAAPRVAVVNEAFARSFLDATNPIAQTFRLGADEYQVVGVCRDAKCHGMREAGTPTIFLSFRQATPGEMGFELRSLVPPLSLVPGARKIVAAIDPRVPLAQAGTQTQVLEGSVAFERLGAALCGALAALAVLISGIGVYGLMAYTVARRTSEIGVRMALGAQRGTVLRQILRETLAIAGWGIGLGLPVALGAALAARAAFYGVSPTEPTIIIGAVGLLLMAATIAAWLPAHRATQVDPIVALRAE